MGRSSVVLSLGFTLAAIAAQAQITPRQIVEQKLHEMVAATKNRNLDWFKKNLAADFKAIEPSAISNEQVVVNKERTLERIEESFQMFENYSQVQVNVVSFRQSEGKLVVVTHSTVAGVIVSPATKRRARYSDVSEEEDVWAPYGTGNDYKLRTMTVLKSRVTRS